MLTDKNSCFECKLEATEEIWATLLYNWVNKCVLPDAKIKQLNSNILIKIVHRYNNDISTDDDDEAVLNTGDIEQYLNYKYPTLNLRYITEDKNMSKKMYIMTSVLLFHFCCNAKVGEADVDIYRNLSMQEQELIFKFCAKLDNLEVTLNDVERAVKESIEALIRKRGLKSFYDFYDENYRHRLCVDDSLSSDSSSKQSGDAPSNATLPLDDTPNIGFKNTSVTVLPSVINVNSPSSVLYDIQYGKCANSDFGKTETIESMQLNVFLSEVDGDNPSNLNPKCHPDCNCPRCNYLSSNSGCTKQVNWKVYTIGICAIVLLIIIIVFAIIPILSSGDAHKKALYKTKRLIEEVRIYQPNSWHCVHNMCQRVYRQTNERIYTSHSRCILLCMGPQLWPYPIGYTHFSKDIVALATSKLEYKSNSFPSETIQLYVDEAFKLFVEDLATLEKIGTEYFNASSDLTPKKMIIQIEVEFDPDPRLRLNTEEAYTLKIENIANIVEIKVASASYCGVRHGLETLSQLILLDQDTGYLITTSNAVVKDAPSYKYRGLMIDTGRNYVPVPDLMRTLDAMAMTKLNTFHWRISDVTSFPLLLPKLPQLFEYGSYSRSMVYTKEDVKSIVKRANIKGIRVLIEVAIPGPVGRAWSWSSDATCRANNDNNTCHNGLCMQLQMNDALFDILEIIYSEIIDMTNVDDIFHLSDGAFSFINCFDLMEEREGFLDKALERLKVANNGLLPKLPIIWYTSRLTKELEAKTWERFGVQLIDWPPGPLDQFLSRFSVIHSSRWDLSCEMQKHQCIRYRTWQDMYAWKSWRTLEVFTIEGGEAILWTDLVNSGNLDTHLWPRAAAVAERLWSDGVINATATPEVYVRLDHLRWRMLLRSVKMHPVWPVWCSFNPWTCLQKLQDK